MADLCCMTKCWSIKRVGRSENTDIVKEGESLHSSNDSNEKNDDPWLYFNSAKDPIHLYLTESSFIIIKQSDLVIEIINLLTEKDALRVITKGDSILFIHRSQTHNRKFRLQFDAEMPFSGTEQCQKCIKELCNYVEVQIGPDIQNLSVLKFTDIVNAIADPTHMAIPGVLAGQNIDSDLLEEAVACCLLEHTFPHFVEAVEKCLQTLTS